MGQTPGKSWCPGAENLLYKPRKLRCGRSAVIAQGCFHPGEAAGMIEHETGDLVSEDQPVTMRRASLRRSARCIG
jgi:hypothetical protein